MGKYPRGADQAAGPFAATLNLARIEQDKVLAGFRARMIAVSRVEIGDVVRWAFQRMIAHAPADAAEVGDTIADQFDAR